PRCAPAPRARRAYARSWSGASRAGASLELRGSRLERRVCRVPRERGPGETRQAEHERCTSAGCLDGAAPPVGPGDRVDDREPETDTSLRAAPRRVRAREALEDAVERVRRDATAAVRYPDLEQARSRAGLKLDRVRRLRVLDRVLEQRVERDPEALAVGA